MWRSCLPTASSTLLLSTKLSFLTRFLWHFFLHVIKKVFHYFSFLLVNSFKTKDLGSLRYYSNEVLLSWSITQVIDYTGYALHGCIAQMMCFSEYKLDKKKMNNSDDILLKRCITQTIHYSADVTEVLFCLNHVLLT